MWILTTALLLTVSLLATGRSSANGLPAGVHRMLDADGIPSFSDAPLDRRTGLRTRYLSDYGRKPAVAWCRGVDTATIETRGQRLLPAFYRVAAQHGLDPQLLRAVARVESCFSPDAVSRAGAEGLMQLMPATARSLGVSDSFDVAHNLEGGATYLAGLLTRYQDDLALALAAYNAGPGNVDRYQGIPPFPETNRYIEKVQRHYARYRRLSESGAGSAAAAPNEKRS